MLKELYTASMGMMPQQTRLEVIANNMANANTPGFKRESIFERNLIEATEHFYNVPGDVEQDDPPYGSYIDFSKGAFEKTDNPLDIAIENSKGFFVMRDAEGNEFLSRSGHFMLSPDGTIEATDGKLLMGADGPLSVQFEYHNNPLNLNDSKAVELRISENGEVFANNQNIGMLRIVNVDNPQSLHRVSNANFVASELTVQSEIMQENVAVRQGWLENANVDIVSEMVTMIELQRMFEAGSKVIQTNDGTLDQSMRVGRFY